MYIQHTYYVHIYSTYIPIHIYSRIHIAMLYSIHTCTYVYVLTNNTKLISKLQCNVVIDIVIINKICNTFSPVMQKCNNLLIISKLTNNT